MLIFAIYGTPGGTENRTVNLLWHSCGYICPLLCDL